MASCATDNDGKIIPASQRPDGTWRKARRVKDGYVPQEEVPLYESKGKQFANKSVSSLPVGMCPIIAEQNRLKREKVEKMQNNKNIVPGLININSVAIAANMVTAAGAISSGKKKNGKRKLGDKQTATTPTVSSPAKSQPLTKIITTAMGHTNIIEESIKELTLNNNTDIVVVGGEDSIEKKLKKLRKKIREIELIEEKLNTGELKKPDQDQLDKVNRKLKIQQEIKKLERSAPGV